MENEIIVQGKKIDISKLTDEQIVKLYKQLAEQELKYDKKIVELEKKIKILEENQ